MLPPDLVEIVGKTYGFGISVDENKKSSEVEKSSAMKVWSLNNNMLRRIKSLHHDSTYSMKKQCTNVIKTDKLENGEGEETKSGLFESSRSRFFSMLIMFFLRVCFFNVFFFIP